MIIQNSSTNQTGQPVRQAGDDASMVHAEPSQGVTVKSPRIATEQTSIEHPSAEKLKEAIGVINQVMQRSNNALEFSVDPASKLPIVKLIDTETGELIRQFPTEETLAIARSIDQYQMQHGMLLKQKA